VSIWKAGSPPNSEHELLQRCRSLQGLTLGRLASTLNLAIPPTQLQRKGWIGHAIELFLGATAGPRPVPDFENLGVELKTIPIGATGRPCESTFVTSISLLTIHQETWLTSTCYNKLRKVLWIPIESNQNIPFSQRQIGSGFLWSPDQPTMKILEQDWLELTFMLTSGQMEKVSARLGTLLQVRPKAANAQSLCYGFDELGNQVQTLPRGFYLRSKFTSELLKSSS
jgi:DNA mismatch repair protein MutH